MELLKKIIQTEEKENISLCGMTNEFFCAYINNLYTSSNKSILVLTSTLYEANNIYNSAKNYNDNVYLFPMDDFLTSQSIAMSPELKAIRLNTINKIINNEKNIVICHLESFLRFLPSKKILIDSIIKLQTGDIFSKEKLSQKIINIGYSRQSIVTNTGEIGIRGFVIDVFPVDSDFPVRIEFFDDEIESIKEFDPDTQKTTRIINKVELFPNTEFLCDKELIDNNDFNQKKLPKYCKDITNILGYLNDSMLIIKDKHQILSSYNKKIEEIFKYNKEKDPSFNGKYMFELNEFNLDNAIYYNTIENYFENKSIKTKDFNVKKVPDFHEDIEKINSYIEMQLYKNMTIIICLKDFQIKSFSKYLKHSFVLTDDKNIIEKNVNIINFSMQEGFIYGNYVFITSKELFNKSDIIKYKQRYKYTSKIKSINNLEIGDYVVHSTYGISIYNGIKTLSKQGIKKDYLELLYAGTDKLYVPVEKIELVGKYTGKEGFSPRISALNSSEWRKNKLRVKNRVHDIAKKLIEIYAKRKLKKGFAFAKDDELQIIFDGQFEFTETPDQIRAIEQIKADMENPEPMDRLLCGDVGYGKTEVAFRAMFKAVNSSKQVLYLCPTTILSSQQYEKAKKRFSKFPVNIELINRFTSQKQVNKIVEDLSNGKIDILFGTHRLLSNDIKPKELGLLVIDEEQRFGVAHKEKIKEYKENIDVLTLSATPIPRTLQMSLIGMRSLSLIETPPVDRYPIQTYVIEENALIVRDAIYKELGRNGQVFVLYNNVKHIDEKVNEIKSLVPEARVVFTHGQLTKNELEQKMIDFIDHKYDVMICTTIIETGIDINNVNTLIIYDADHFGLSQLYQIRGRVGRSNKIAYAYLMYKKDKVLNEVAVKRLQAIKEFTELGSGFSIASRDLSIRGAGDILGSEQAGFIDTVGIDLYLKILNEEVEKLKGNIVEEEEIQNEPNLIDVETHVSDEYVSDEDLKIEIHRLINTIDSYERLEKVKLEIEDRFGKINENLLIYMYEEWFEAMAKNLEIIKANQNNKYIELSFSNEMSQKIDGEKIFTTAIRITRNYSFSYKNDCLKIILNLSGLEKHYIYYLTDLLSKIVDY